MWISVLNVAGKTKYQVHQEVYSFFTDRVELHGRDFCYRSAGGEATVYSQNRMQDDSAWIEFKKGDEIRFSLICCPGRGTYRDESGKRHRMTPRQNIEDVFSWLERRLNGTAVLRSVSGKRLGRERIERPGGRVMTFPTWLLSGEVEVRQPLSFESIVTAGVGQGAGFGLGQIKIEA